MDICGILACIIWLAIDPVLSYQRNSMHDIMTWHVKNNYVINMFINNEILLIVYEKHITRRQEIPAFKKTHGYDYLGPIGDITHEDVMS